MLIVDPYSLLPAFTLAGFLGILLWPENIAYRMRLLLFMIILIVWLGASLFAISGYGSSERPFVCLINTVVGLFGFIAVLVTYVAKPSRNESRK